MLYQVQEKPMYERRAIQDEEPTSLTVDLPATIRRDLVVYAEAIGRETG